MHWDGNIFWRTDTGSSNQLFAGFGGGNYASLAAFVAVPNTIPWERTDSLQIDPGYNTTAIQQAEKYDAATVRDLYRPSNRQVFTPGVSYDGLGWPGTAGVTYRGAIAPDVRSMPPTNLRIVDTD
jgi:hypothetical protein